MGCIAPCIRELTLYGDGMVEKSWLRLRTAFTEAARILVDNLGQILPNLETLRWYDTWFDIAPPAIIYRSLLSSKINHVTIETFYRKPVDITTRPPEVFASSTLQTLSLGDASLSALSHPSNNSTEATMLAKLFHYCAPSLRQIHGFVGHEKHYIYKYDHLTSLKNENGHFPRFEKLRDLSIPDMFSDRLSWEALLSAPLNTFTLLYPGPGKSAPRFRLGGLSSRKGSNTFT